MADAGSVPGKVGDRWSGHATLTRCDDGATRCNGSHTQLGPSVGNEHSSGDFGPDGERQPFRMSVHARAAREDLHHRSPILIFYVALDIAPPRNALANTA